MIIQKQTTGEVWAIETGRVICSMDEVCTFELDKNTNSIAITDRKGIRFVIPLVRVTGTQLLPASVVPFAGDLTDLWELLITDFFDELHYKVLGDAISDLQTDVSNLQDDVSNLFVEIEFINGDIDNLQDDVTELMLGQVPIGFILAFPNISGSPTPPSNWQLCNGSLITNVLSPMVGSNTPSINGTNRFLRGATTGGGTGGTSSHSHQVTIPIDSPKPAALVLLAADVGADGTYTTTTTSHIPPYIDVIYYIRIY